MWRLRPLACAGGICLQVLMLGASARAQGDSAMATGTVRNSQRSAIAEASLVVRNVETGLTRETSTTEDGRYWLGALPPGRYELTAAREGFKTVVRSGVVLTLGAEAVLDVELPVADIAETVAVTADVPMVDTTTAAIATWFSRDQLALLPLSNRDYFPVLRLAPGAQGFAGAFTGSRDRSNEFALDGVDNTSDISGFSRSGIVLDSIREVQVLANNYKAEYGRASGGIVNVVSRSGLNRPSGRAFLLVSDAALNSRSPYANRLVPDPPFRMVMFGGTASGPLVRDRWHHFVTYEGTDQQSQSEGTQMLPASTAPFSASTREFLAMHGIPMSMFGAGGLMRQVRPERLDAHNVVGRVDGRIDAAQTIGARYTFRRSARSSGRGGTLLDYNGDTSLVRDHYAAASHKWVLESNRLNEVYVQAGHTLSDFQVAYPALTNIVVSGSFSLGGNTSFPQGRSEPLYQVTDNFTLLRSGGRAGDHAIKLGANVKIFRSDSYFDANARGTFTFATLQQFILGQPASFTQFRGDTRLARPNTLWGLYLQDDWRPRTDLTVNLGLRYDYESARTEALREISGEAGPGIGRDRNNFAPRLGIVWAPGGGTTHAVHAGAGIYYDQVVLNILGNVRFTPPKVIGVTIANPSFPDPVSGLQTVPPPAIQTIDPALTTPYNFNASAGYRRELGSNLGLDVSYVHNRGWGQIMTIDRNAGMPGTANILGQGARRKDPAIASDTFSTNLGFIRYQGLLVDLRRRSSGWMQGGVVYTLAKTVDNGANFATPVQVPSRPDLNAGPSSNDRRHELKGHVEVMLPFDIQWAAVVEHYGEAPLDVTAARDLNGDGISGDWVNGTICLTVSCPGFAYSRNRVRELSTEDANRLRALFGLAPIAEFANNPKYLNVNMALQKSVRLGMWRARVRGEAFNVFNTPQRVIGSTVVTSALFGTYVAVVQPRTLQVTALFDW